MRPRGNALRNALVEACKSGVEGAMLPALEKFLENPRANANFIFKDDDGRTVTLFQWSCMKRWKTAVDKIATRLSSRQINQKTDYGTAIYWVLECDYFDVFKRLIRPGVNLNISHDNEISTTPLMGAAIKSRWDFCMYILPHLSEDEVYCESNEDKTAMDYAVENGAPEEIIELFQLFGEEDSEETEIDQVFHIIKHNMTLAFEALAHNGRDLDVENEDGKRALEYAIECGHFGMLKCFIEQGSDMNHIGSVMLDHYASSSIHHALSSDSSHADLIETLIEMGVSVDEVNEAGLSALQVVQHSERFDVMNVFLGKGIGDEIEFGSKLTHVYHAGSALTAVENGWRHFLPVLAKMGTDFNVPNEVGDFLIQLATARGDVGTVRSMIQQCGANPNVGSENKPVPLQIAVGLEGNENTYEMIRCLVVDGRCDLSLCETPISDWKGQFSWADSFVESIVYMQDIECMETLLGKVVDLNERVRDANREGNGLLHLAAAFGSLKMVRYLVTKKRIDANDVNSRGENALHCAVEHKCVDVVKYLVYYCDPTALNDDNMSAIDIAQDVDWSLVILLTAGMSDKQRRESTIDGRDLLEDLTAAKTAWIPYPERRQIFEKKTILETIESRFRQQLNAITPEDAKKLQILETYRKKTADYISYLDYCRENGADRDESGEFRLSLIEQMASCASEISEIQLRNGQIVNAHSVFESRVDRDVLVADFSTEKAIVSMILAEMEVLFEREVVLCVENPSYFRSLQSFQNTGPNVSYRRMEKMFDAVGAEIESESYESAEDLSWESLVNALELLGKDMAFRKAKYESQYLNGSRLQQPNLDLPDLFVRALFAQERLEFEMKKLAKVSDGVLEVDAGVKSMYRCKEKRAYYLAREGNDVDRSLWDLSRARISYNSLNDMVRGYHALNDKSKFDGVEVVDLKSRFSGGNQGWKSLAVYLIFVDDEDFPPRERLICEAEFCLTKLILARKELGEESDYATYRCAVEIQRYVEQAMI